MTNNEWVLFLSLVVIVSVPFYFKYWMHSYKPVLAIEIQKKTQSLSLIIFFSLFFGTFVFNENSRSAGPLLLFASIISFCILYSSAVKKPAHPKRNLRRSFTQIAIGASLFALFAFHPLFIVFTLFSLPFLGPIILRLQYSCEVLAPSPLRTKIESAFARSQAKVHEIYLVESPTDEKNAFITGHKSGGKLFGTSLFLTLGLIEQLSETEIESVVCHEITHLKLGHIQKRLLNMLLAFTLACTLMASFIFILTGVHFIGFVAAAFIGFIFQTVWMKKVIMQQELEADTGSILLGASPLALANALLKLGNGQDQGLYPRTEMRIQEIQKQANISHLEIDQIVRSA